MTATRTPAQSRTSRRPKRVQHAAAAPQLASIARCGPDGRVWLVGEADPCLLLAAAGPLSAGMQVLVLTVGSSRIIVGRVQDRQPPGQADRLELSASAELVLSCGAASLTLTKAGKAILAGEYVLSRATGVNKIKGGSVQIN